ncbi:MAG TPA: hypothetical protein VFF79_08270 [Conexibacter sp.]|jgi:hypothetical protein|nr:hypothetical protein [Conexibacter sp.]
MIARDALADPRRAIGWLTDELPLLLFPLRLETRFKRGANGLELWVRVFPDSCLVDTFEPEPSRVEVDSVRRYWQAVWRARDEGGERAAWRNLVASHGVGRGHWLTEHHAPLNPGDRPPPPAAGTLLLAIPGEDGISAAEAAALVQRWEQAWRDGADGAAEAHALEQLAAALGDKVRAQALWEATRPLGLGDPPPPGVPRAAATVVTVLMRFPAAAGARERSWNQPPVVELLPERLLCVVETAGGPIEALGEPIPSPLHVGVDPTGAPTLRPLDGDLELPDELRWTVDFQRAVKDGLGFKLKLSKDQWAHGADRVTVLGVRLGDDPKQARARFEQLLAHHRDGRSGLSLVAQGTPTNNTEQEGAGHTRQQEADAAFDELRAGGDLGGPAPPPLERRDGRWLADGLGIDPSLLSTVPGAHGVDQLEARAMNVALWPATLGYFAQTMMAPRLGEDTVEQLRSFFVDHVSGRGPLPAIRIGEQPYGILPAIAFDRTFRRELRPAPARPRETDAFLARLLVVLHVADADWEALAAQLTALGTPGQDVEAALLEVLGLHPASAEYHFRYAESLDQVFNFAGLFGLSQALLLALVRAGLDKPALELLMRIDPTSEIPPAILERYFFDRQGRLLGDVVDDRPLSEHDPVRVWTDDGDNYLRWLERAARDSLEALRVQQGFLDGRPPTALLYLLLQHALVLGYADAGVRLRRTAGLSDAQLAALRREPPFVHVAGAAQSESRWAPLLEQNAAITGDPGLSVAEAIAKEIGGRPEVDHLRDQLDALGRLITTPTARLERLLAEHVDTCSYRFDAWRIGWLTERLERMRAQAPDGLHLGAYGCLLDVRPSTAKREPVELPEALARVFQRKQDAPLERDSANGGYVHAPSSDQAVTAAVLRAGYLSNASHGNPTPLSVNLSSERVRLALATLEGMRNGQRLGALLGYRLERGLHDGHPGLELDRFVLPLRTAFPLVAERIRDTRTDAGTSVDLVAASNVVDGLRLVEQVESDARLASYPFGRADVLPGDASAGERAAIEAEVDRLRNVNDAVGDLLLAESVHLAAQGRYDGSAAALDALSVGGHPPEPEVVRTPRPGVALTHRLALHFDPRAVAAARATPRAAAEPRLDRWLEAVLPDLAEIAVHVTWKDPRRPGDAIGGEATVTLAELGLRPVDLLAVVHADGGQQMAELDDRVVRHVLASGAVPLDVLPQIAYLDALDRRLVRVFDVAAPVRRLRSLVGHARPLRGADALLANDATQAAADDVARDPAPVVAALRGLQGLASDLARQVGALDSLASGPPAALGAAIDGAVDDTGALFDRAALHGVPQTGWGFAYLQRSESAAGLLARLAARVQTWQAKRHDFDLLLAEYDGLDPQTSQRGTLLSLLRRAEICVSATVTDEPPDLRDLRSALPARASAFDARLGQLAAVVDGPPATLAALLSAADGLLPLTDVDLEPFDLGDELGRDAQPGNVGRLAADLLATATVVQREVERRATAAAAAMRLHDGAETAPARVEALTQAAQAIFGDAFVLVPDAGVAPADAAAVAAALTAASSGELTRHLTARLGVELPVDEWLTGVARVREQARAWEQVAIQAGAFGRDEPQLTPLQLPYAPGDSWLALAFEPGTALDRDRLLYTASLPAGFDPAARRCGLLLDEWTEVIPADRQDTAIATHFDRPSSEPPQALLLVLPTQQTGGWVWEDVAGALDDTLRLARKRAVEPIHVDGTPWARFLPATVWATTLRGVSIGLALALNNTTVAEIVHKEVGDG